MSELEWKLPDRVIAGERFDVAVVVTGREGTKVDAVTLAFEGILEWSEDESSQSISTHSAEETLLRETRKLGAREVFTASFRAPKDAIPTLENPAMRWRLRFFLSIPWHFDFEDWADVVVVARTIEAPEPEPWRSLIEMESGIRAEMVLDDRHLAPGMRINARFVLFDLAGRNVYSVAIVLAQIQAWKSGNRTFSRVVRSIPCFSRDKGFVEGAIESFTIAVPSDAVPSFEVPDRPGLRIRWAARVMMEDDQHSEKADIEVDVGPYEPREVPDAAAKIPLGTERWRSLLTNICTSHALVLADEEDDRVSAEGELSGLPLTIALEPTEMRADLHWPSFEIALVARPDKASGRRVKGLEIGKAQVYARDPEQARALLGEAMLEALEPFDHVRLSDEHALVTRSAGVGHASDRLEKFMKNVEALANAVNRTMPQVPPPSSMRTAIPAWRAFAEERGGTLANGSLALRGIAWGGASLSLETTFDDDGAPNGARVTLRPSWKLAGEIPSDLQTQIPFPCTLAVGPELVELTLPSPLHDPRTIAPGFDVMVAIAERLAIGGAHGPYR